MEQQMDLAMTFPDFLAGYWWLIFPLAWFISAGWSSWMKYKKHQANLDLLKAYAASGNEPPAALIAALKSETKSDELGLGDGSGMGADMGTGDGSWDGGASPFLVILFVGLAAVFAYATKTGMLDLGEEGYFVAMIMIVLALAFLGGAIFIPRNKKK